MALSGCRFGGGQSECRTKAPPARCVFVGAYSGRVRRLLLLVSSIIFVDALLFTALTPLVPGYADEFDLSKAGAGLLVGAYGAGALFGGIPGGLAAARFGPKRAVVGGLLLLSVASFAFAVADSAAALGAARFVQGISSTATWAGALAWISVTAPRARRGEVIGTAFGAAVFGAVLGPSSADLRSSSESGSRSRSARSRSSSRGSTLGRSMPVETATFAGRHALRDERFLGGLWLNTLPAMLFGVLIVLTPLALDEAGWTTAAIAAVFFAAGLLEVLLNPFLGRLTDRVGRLLPIRVALTASVVSQWCSREPRVQRSSPCSSAPLPPASAACTRRAWRSPLTAPRPSVSRRGSRSES